MVVIGLWLATGGYALAVYGYRLFQRNPKPFGSS